MEGSDRRHDRVPSPTAWARMRRSRPQLVVRATLLPGSLSPTRVGPHAQRPRRRSRARRPRRATRGRCKHLRSPIRSPLEPRTSFAPRPIAHPAAMPDRRRRSRSQGRRAARQGGRKFERSERPRSRSHHSTWRNWHQPQRYVTTEEGALVVRPSGRDPLLRGCDPRTAAEVKRSVVLVDDHRRASHGFDQCRRQVHSVPRSMAPCSSTAAEPWRTWNAIRNRSSTGDGSRSACLHRRRDQDASAA